MKSDKEKQISYTITYMWNLKRYYKKKEEDTINKSTYKTDWQTSKTNIVTQGEMWGEG